MSSKGKGKVVEPSSGVGKVVEPSSGVGRSPCAACQHLERLCGPECMFAPHFPAGDDPAAARFVSVHAAFGADNVARFLSWIHPERRTEAVHWLVRNTTWRLAVAPERQPSAAAALSGGGTPPPCAACRYLQITCVPGCVFAPHFPAGEGLARFAALHARFGPNDIALILCGLSPEKQVEAIGSLFRLAQQPTAAAGAGTSASPPPPPPPLPVERRCPCVACKLFRRKCEASCIFRPHYPPGSDPKRFDAVHEVYGASNLATRLREVPPELRGEATKWATYEAQRRQRDPVHGVTSDILILETLRKMLEEQLAATRRELATYIDVEAASRSFVPAHQPQLEMMLGVTEQMLEDGVRAAAQQVMAQAKADAAAGVTQFVTPLHEKLVKDMTLGSSTGATAAVPGSSAQSSTTDIYMEEQPSQAPTAAGGLTAVVPVRTEPAATILMLQPPSQAPTAAAGVQDPGVPEVQDAGDEPSPGSS